MKIFVVKNKQFIVSAKPPSKKKGKAKKLYLSLIHSRLITPTKNNLCYLTGIIISF